MKRAILFTSVIIIGLLTGGCTFKRTTTSPSTHLDGTKVDFTQMEKYKKAETCYDVKKTEDASISILEASKKADISNIVYVDRTITGDIACVIVYGE